LLKDADFRKKVSSCFNSTGRDEWQDAHASKTDPPDVGKYKPKYNRVWSDERAAVILQEHLHIGQKRI